MARHKKTNKEKDRQGTRAKSRDVKMVFKPMTEVPEPFEQLNDDGKRYFEYICQILIDNNVMTAAWIPDITALAWYWQCFMENKRLVDKNGTIQTANSGYRQKAPELTNATALLDDLRKGLKNYGLTPVDMAKLPTLEDDEDMDDLYS